ncbi:hypothetical protein, partial [Vibrio cholerae]
MPWWRLWLGCGCFKPDNRHTCKSP